MRDKMIAVGVLALLLFGVLMVVLGGHKSESSGWFASGESGGAFQAQVVGGNSSGGGPIATIGARAGQLAHFPAISQRDRQQYASDAEWQTWAASACSAAAMSSVLNGYGVPVRITDVLAQMQQMDAIKAGAGLYRYEAFNSIAAKYNLKTVYSEEKDVDSHFDHIIGYLRQGYPVILNILDSNFFPNGHFIVATGINPDGTIAIINPDPTRDKSVNQNWPVEGLKLYFSRMTRSAAILPAS